MVPNPITNNQCHWHAFNINCNGKVLKRALYSKSSDIIILVHGICNVRRKIILYRRHLYHVYFTQKEELIRKNKLQKVPLDELGQRHKL